MIAAGAGEIDMVIPVGVLLAGDFSRVEDDVAQVVIAARDIPVKAIIECCYLDDALKRRATELVIRAGVAYVKTSTGFGPSGAELEDVKLLSSVSADRIGVKAAGGIRTLAGCEAFINAGATRIGTSSGVAIMHEWQARIDGR